MTGLGEEVYTPPRADVDAMVEAAAIAAIGADRYAALPNDEDYRYRKENAEAEYWSKREALDTFRAALDSLGVPLETLAALRSGEWVAVPKVPTIEMTEALAREAKAQLKATSPTEGCMKVNFSHVAVFKAGIVAAPKTPEAAR